MQLAPYSIRLTIGQGVGRCGNQGRLALVGVLVLAGCASSLRNRATDDVVAGRQRMLRGIEAWQEQDLQLAEENFRAAVETAPQDERAHFHYARALWQRDDRASAMKHMAEAVRLSGGSSELLVEMGRMHLAEGQLDLAESTAQQVLESDRQFATAHALLGDVHLRRGRLELALESYHLSLALQPKNSRVQLAVADIYRTWGEPRRSLATLQAIDIGEVPPDQAATIHHLQGVAQREIGRPDDAIEDFKKALAAAPPTAALWCDLAEAQALQGDHEGARRSISSALALDTQRTTIEPQLARIEERLLR